MRALLIVLLIGCGGARPAPATPEVVSPELSKALTPLNWWLGDWNSGGGQCGGAATGKRYTEHWVAVSGAIYGAAFSEQGFEVMIVDDGDAELDGVLRFIAMPMGERTVEFSQREVGARTVTFANPAHDDPKAITYAREGDQLRAVLVGEQFLKFDFCPGTRESAPELEAADRAFAADTAQRGIEGWMAAFEPRGGMMRKGARVEGDGIREMMGPLLGKGTLAWEPVASGRAGTLGFTVGKATYTGADTWRSSYITIWRQQPDGGWKVLFDTGRPVHEP
jgi:hypothetical protein